MDFGRILNDALNYLHEGNETQVIEMLSRCSIDLYHDPDSSYAEAILIEVRCNRADYDQLQLPKNLIKTAIIKAVRAVYNAPDIGFIAKYAPSETNSTFALSTSTNNGFPLALEPLLATLARMFAVEGNAREVAILANAKPKVVQTEYDNWNGGTYTYCLYIQVPAHIYSQVSDVQLACEEKLLEQTRILLNPYPDVHLAVVSIIPLVAANEDWREKALNWSSGKGVNNQGRVRSDNIAAKECDGLLFRSNEEINLYKALKALGVSFAPLPVFLRGGETYRRIEPDFVILKDGIVLIVEVDGDTVHEETPAEAHARTTMLSHEGAHIERVKASECRTPELAENYARGLLKTVQKIKSTR